MATPRPLSSYPPRYFEIFRRGASEHFEIECVSPGDASNLRDKLYAFRRSLLALAETAPETAILADTVTLAIRKNILVVRPRE